MSPALHIQSATDSDNLMKTFQNLSTCIYISEGDLISTGFMRTRGRCNEVIYMTDRPTLLLPVRVYVNTHLLGSLFYLYSYIFLFKIFGHRRVSIDAFNLDPCGIDIPSDLIKCLSEWEYVCWFILLYHIIVYYHTNNESVMI